MDLQVLLDLLGDEGLNLATDERHVRLERQGETARGGTGRRTGAQVDTAPADQGTRKGDVQVGAAGSTQGCLPALLLVHSYRFADQRSSEGRNLGRQCAAGLNDAALRGFAHVDVNVE